MDGNAIMRDNRGEQFGEQITHLNNLSCEIKVAEAATLLILDTAQSCSGRQNPKYK